MPEYRFLTAWLVAAPRDRIYDELYDVASWPQWWKGVTRTVELEPHRRFVIAWRSLLPYDLEFDMTVTKTDRPHLLEGHAVGELEGVGRWRLFEEQGVTAVTYEWQVRTTKRWMNLLAPVARPIFEWNHDYVMRQGGVGLARRVMAPPSEQIR